MTVVPASEAHHNGSPALRRHGRLLRYKSGVPIGGGRRAVNAPAPEERRYGGVAANKEFGNLYGVGKYRGGPAKAAILAAGMNGAISGSSIANVVTTGTFAPMCSSGAFINFGHSTPTIKTGQVWLNDVPAYAGIAAVDCYLGATEPSEDDPLNKVYPGEFRYGGGHVIQDFGNINVAKSIAIIFYYGQDRFITS